MAVKINGDTVIDNSKNVISGDGITNTGIAIYHGAGTGDYGRIRFYQDSSNNSTIHSFSTAWQSGTLSSHSTGAINLKGANGVTIGQWDAINSSGHWFDKSGNGQSSASFRSPIFYDSNNTVYYCDPSSTTSLRTVGSWRSDSSNWDGDPGTLGKIQYHANKWYLVAGSDSAMIVQFRRNGTDLSYIDNSGNFVGNVTGNAATATNVAWTGITGTPSTYPPGSHTHSAISDMTDEHRIFNNMGDNHGTRTTFDAQGAAASVNFGWRFVQGSTNSPGVNSAGQYYSQFVGLGNEYAYNNYGMQIAYPRNVTNPYIAIRYEEGGAFGAWQKISAGYADSAGSAPANGGNADTVDSLHASSFIRSDADTGISSGVGPRFGHANQTDGNDGFIAAGKFASGLNIVGTQTVAGTGRQVRIWGSLIDSAGNAYLTTVSSLNTSVSSLGVGVAASGTTGEIRATNNITAYYSDERLKDFHGTIPNALEKISQLNGYYFTENQTAKDLGYSNDRVQVGLSAQEVERVLPEVVTDAPIENDQGYKTIWYDKMVPLLVEAIKEQQQIINDQNARLISLEKQLHFLLNKNKN